GTIPSNTLLASSYHCCAAHRDLHSFPTRRSSDLPKQTSLAATDFLGDKARAAADRAILRSKLAGPPALPADVLACTWCIRSGLIDRKSTRLNSSHVKISYAVLCLKK